MRPRLAVATTFPVHPPLGGGQVRVHNLYRRLARWFDVEIVSLTSGGRERQLAPAPGLRETVVPKTAVHEAQEQALEREVGHVVTDIAVADHHRLTPRYQAALRDACAGAEAVVACHPYVVGAIREATDLPLWYEAQDVEAALKGELLGDGDAAAPLLETVARVERACCEQASSIWTCSAEDRDELVARYGADEQTMLIVPNGADLTSLRYADSARRRELRAELRLPARLLTLFVASWHQPNIVGAEELVRCAERLPDVGFLILGSVGLALLATPTPANLQLTGPVSAAFKEDVLSIADVALNPVTSGSGTNLKMLDYFGSGIPVVSSAFGARGLGVTAGVHYVAAEPHDLPATLRRLREGDPAALDHQTRAARSLVEEHLSWDVIVSRLAEALGLVAVL